MAYQTCIAGFLLLLASCSAQAHVAGVTDTSLAVSRDGAVLVFTVPIDSLNEIVKQRLVSGSAEIEQYVRSRFTLKNGDADCAMDLVDTRELPDIGSRQFEYLVKCSNQLTELTVGYELFFELNPEHENFTRISLLRMSQNIVFNSDYRQHTIPVEQIVLQLFTAQEQSRQDAGDLLTSGRHYFKVGIEHILTGYDHLIFLFALLLLPTTIQRLLLLITTFTVAHSVTLALSVLDLVIIRPAIVESAIALSIVIVAIDNCRTLHLPSQQSTARILWRRRLIFVFILGLIHGFGFSYILKQMGLGDQVLSSLLFFNLGVEAGQLFVLSLVLPIIVWSFSRSGSITRAQAGSVLVGLVGLYWLIERSVGLVSDLA